MSTPLTLDQINSRLEDVSKLTAIRFSEPLTSFKRRVVCRCICNNLKSFDISNLLYKKTVSCGCIKKTTALSISDINKKIKSSYLIAIQFSETRVSKSGNRCRMCLCLCKCGKSVNVAVGSLVMGTTKSCGCIRIGKSRPIKYTVYNPVIYQCWKHIISRCYNKYDKRYMDYGGRGITVCFEWKNSYQSFLDWAILNGWKKGLQLDKDIKIQGSIIYSPDTCSWVTKIVNSRHKRNSLYYEINGLKISLKEHLETLNLTERDYNRIRFRINKGWDINDAINTPAITLKRAYIKCDTATPKCL